MKTYLILFPYMLSQECGIEKDRICRIPKGLIYSPTGNQTTVAIAPTIPVTTIPVEKNETAQVKPKPKEGFNYASFDCGAVVRAANKEAKNPTSVLLNAKDAYLLSPCSSDIFVEMELCQDILVKAISLANFEYFSSMFKDFEVFGSSNYPPDWKPLGTFTAKNSRDRQYFSIENPVIWVKYVKLLIRSHYGNEYYCPITSFQVFGTTMMEEAKEYQDLKPDDQEPSNNTIVSPNPVVLAPEPLKTLIPATCPDVEPTMPDELEYSTTSLPTPTKQDSIFAKIIQRLSLLEKAASGLSNDLVELRKVFTKSQSDNQKSLESLEAKLQKTIALIMNEQEIELKIALEDIERQRDLVDRKLVDVMQVVDALKNQLSWSQFWNQVLFFMCIIAIKVVNDRVGLWKLIFKDQNDHRPRRD